METVIYSSNIELLCESQSWSSNFDMNESRSSLVDLDDSDSGDDISFLEIASVDAKDMATIIEKMADLKKLMDLLIKRLRDHDLKVDKFIKFLKNKKEAVDKSYRKQNFAVSFFSGISATGGAIILIGGAGAVVTAGASLPLVVAGGITTVIGTGGSVPTKYFSNRRRRLIIQECNEELRKIESDTEEIGAIYEKFRCKCIEACEIHRSGAPSSQEDLSFEPTGKKSITATPRRTAQVGLRVVRLFNLLAKVSNALHLEIVGEAIIPAIKTVFKFGTAITGIGIGIDLAVGGKALYNIGKGKQCAESKKLALVIDKAECHAKFIKSYLRLLEHNFVDLSLEPIPAARQIAY